MQKHFRTKTTTSALRSIDKLGGLDYYLANTPDKKLGAWGINLRQQLALALRNKRLASQGEPTLPSTNLSDTTTASVVPRSD